MSRIIVKNLPNNIDANKLKEQFSELGYITDLQLKFTPQGKFRKFCFIGYETSEQANAAVKHFNRSYINTSCLQVELCNELGDSKKPKAWSKYSSDSTAFKANQETKEEKVENKEIKSKKKKDKKKTDIQDEEVVEQIKKYKDDPEFIEFMEFHGKGDKIYQFNEIDEEDDENEEISNSNIAKSAISDLEYLKIKIKGDNSETIAKKIVKDNDKKKPFKQYFTIKISNLPYKVTKKDIRRMLNPISPASVRLPANIKGIAYVGFETDKEKRRALIKNKTFLNGKQLTIVDFKPKQDVGYSPESIWKAQEEILKEEESIAESGRIFIRNLSYSVTEDEIQNLFTKYGPIAEIILPIDKLSRQLKGYGIITFVMPEHAVAAYSALDGTILHGRMLHLLPAKAKDNPDEDNNNAEGGTKNYKSEKQKKLKEKSASSHNWNTLFLDLNAVAEVIAKKYNVSKEEVLTSKDAAVRIALGETQLVAETQKFLEENGVQLDAFNQEIKSRSKTIVLVKNLPASTKLTEIRDLFGKYGELGRVLLPPNGITGLVEFLEPSEARIAFRNLAYSKFKHTPLYLEWAPENSLITKDINNKNKDGTLIIENSEEINEDKQEVKEDNEDENVEIIPDINATLFVKNLHFDTTENELKEHFKRCGKIATVTIAKKKDPKKPGTLLSMGYGFVHYYSMNSLNEALRTLQNSELKEHKLELKKSNRTLPNEIINTRKKTNVSKQNGGTKIMVRNIPFEATTKEITDLFKIFGELKFVRLPKKLVGTGKHRGFAFVEFVSKSDAKRAMKTLCQSTHLLGRRLVLEWAEEDDVTTLRKRTARNFHEDEKKKKSKIEIEEEPKDDDDNDIIDGEMEF